MLLRIASKRVETRRNVTLPAVHVDLVAEDDKREPVHILALPLREWVEG